MSYMNRASETKTPSLGRCPCPLIGLGSAGMEKFGARSGENDFVARVFLMRTEPSLSKEVRRSDGEDGRTGVATKTRTRTKRPNLYRVLLLNDDFTPMEFVIHVLERFFQKGKEDATRIMLHVHQSGMGECGIFTYEVAETKVTQVMDFAKQHQHPLQCVMEKK